MSICAVAKVEVEWPMPPSHEIYRPLVSRLVGPWQWAAVAKTPVCKSCFSHGTTWVGKGFSLGISAFQSACFWNVRTEPTVNRLVVIQDMYGCSCNAVTICVRFIRTWQDAAMFAVHTDWRGKLERVCRTYFPAWASAVTWVNRR